MTLDKTIHAAQTQRDPSDDSGGISDSGGPTLLEQAKGWVDVAHAATEGCKQDAVTRLHNRRNRSGQ